MPLRLDRRAGQSIVVPGERPADSVVIVVHAIYGDRVRLEIQADRQQPIYRGEWWQKLLAERDARTRRADR